MSPRVTETATTRNAAAVIAGLSLITVVLALRDGYILMALLCAWMCGFFFFAARRGYAPIGHDSPPRTPEAVREALAVEVSDGVTVLFRKGAVREAIRLHRNETGDGLWEARDTVHKLRIRTLYEAELPPPSPRVLTALAKGNKIEAIKLLREERPQGLKSAKEAVEHYELRRLLPRA
jgi:ribosomal protein L7/L12